MIDKRVATLPASPAASVWPDSVTLRLTGLLVVAFVITAAFRFLALKDGFPNDHFVYISAGRQMLFGEWPTRDWVDPGLPLMFVGSALAQVLLGQTLFAEAMLVCVAFGLAAALTIVAVRQMTGSTTLAVLAAVAEVAIFPRTYGYPKVLAYAAAFWLFGRYLSKPSMARLCAMAASVAVAFLFRHDHGLFLWIGGVLTTMLAPGHPSGRFAIRRSVVFTVFVALLLVPYLAYVQLSGGLWQYFLTAVEFSQREAARQWHVWPRVLGDQTPLESLLVYEFHLLPLVALAVLFFSRRRGDIQAAVATVLPAAVVAVVVNFSFIRDPLNTRLADVIVPAAVLGTWLIRSAWQPSTMRWIVAPLSVLLAAIVGASIVTVGNTLEEIDRAGLLGRARDIPSRFTERATDLQARFAASTLPSGAVVRLIPFFGYLDRCTTAEQRLLVGGFLPEVPFFAERLFAGGQGYFGGSFGSETTQRSALYRLRRQLVPFVILPTDYEKEFEERFPAVADYVHARYVPLTDVPVNQEQSIHVFVDRDLPFVARDTETGWPCYQRNA